MLLDWDEVDYVNAARLGLLVNALDIGSLSPTEFVRFGFAKRYGTLPSLPDGYDERSDPLVLRHYHPPLVVLLLSLISHFESERILRLVQLAGSMLFVAVILFSLRSITGSTGWAEVLIASVLTLDLIQLSLRSISFHGWEGVWSAASAAFVSRWFQDRRPLTGLLLCATAALALGTLETGGLVWVGALISLFLWAPPWRRGDRLGVSTQQLAFGILITLLFVLHVWPGSIVKISLFKIAGFHVYRVGRGEEYAETIRHLARSILPILPILVLSALSAAYLIWKHRSDSAKWGPFLVVGLIYGVSTGRFAIAPQYFVPALAPLLCLVGFAAHRIGLTLGPYFRAGLAGLVLFLVLPAIWPGNHQVQAKQLDQIKRREVLWLGGFLRGHEALVDGGHVYRHYLGLEYSIQPITVAYDGKALLVRNRGMYRTLNWEDVKGKMIVIQNDRQRFFSGPMPVTMLADCPRIKRPTFQVYACSKVREQGGIY